MATELQSPGNSPILRIYTYRKPGRSSHHLVYFFDALKKQLCLYVIKAVLLIHFLKNISRLATLI